MCDRVQPLFLHFLKCFKNFFVSAQFGLTKMTFILVLFSCQTGACLKCTRCVVWSSLKFWSPEIWFERSIHVSLGVSARHAGE